MAIRDGKTQSDHLYNFFYTLFKRKGLVLSVWIATFVGVVFGTFLVTPLWEATAKIRVQYSPKQQLTMFEGITTPGTTVGGINPANDVIQLLTSRELAEKVALQFERDKMWKQKMENPQNVRDRILLFMSKYLNPIWYLEKLGVIKETPENYLADAVDELQSQLEQVELESDTTVVDVAVWGESPQIATDMANTLVRLALGKNIGFSRESVVSTLASTQKQLADADANLRRSQDRIRDFKANTGFVLYAEEARILLQRRDTAESELKDLQGKLLSAKIAKQADHPDVRSLEGLIGEYTQKTIPDLVNQLQALSQREIDYQTLQEELRVRETLYNTLQQKLLELEVLRDSSMGDLEIKVVDPAKVYSDVRPDWPKKLINALVGLIAGLFAGLFAAFFVEFWDSSYRSVKMLEESFHLPVLGAVPRLGLLEKRRLFRRAPVHGESAPSPLRAVMALLQRAPRSVLRYGRIADRLLLEGGTGARKLLVTSPGENEGKSWVSVLLAAVLAKRGKRVLLIETDLRTPSLARILRVPVPRRGVPGDGHIAGLLDFHAGTAELQDVVRRIDGLDIVFAGRAGMQDVDAVEVLSALKGNQALGELMAGYDFVILDTACVKGHTDAVLLSAMADGVVLVVEANKTPRRTIVMAIERLQDAGGHMVGLVLNKRVNYVPEAIQNLIDSV